MPKKELRSTFQEAMNGMNHLQARERGREQYRQKKRAVRRQQQAARKTPAEATTVSGGRNRTSGRGGRSAVGPPSAASMRGDNSARAAAMAERHIQALQAENAKLRRTLAESGTTGPAPILAAEEPSAASASAVPPSASTLPTKSTKKKRKGAKSKKKKSATASAVGNANPEALDAAISAEVAERLRDLFQLDGRK